MILIIGGAHQGKRAYARALGYADDMIVSDVAAQVREMLEAGQAPLAELPCLCSRWSKKAVLLAEIGCGVVPMDAMERRWREEVGRCGAYLARRADRVVRVFCGVGTVLKDA